VLAYVRVIENRLKGGHIDGIFGADGNDAGTWRSMAPRIFQSNVNPPADLGPVVIFRCLQPGTTGFITLQTRCNARASITLT
jgi:hypothetical protein